VVSEVLMRSLVEARCVGVAAMTDFTCSGLVRKSQNPHP
jgi:hypothetical protein